MYADPWSWKQSYKLITVIVLTVIGYDYGEPYVFLERDALTSSLPVLVFSRKV